MQRSEPHITTLMQYGLMAQGHRLPRFGADGQWGDETQEAYDAYVALAASQRLKTCNYRLDN